MEHIESKVDDESSEIIISPNLYRTSEGIAERTKKKWNSSYLDYCYGSW